MGRGIALEFKRRFPDNFAAYAAACKRREVQPGRMFIFERTDRSPSYIVNFPTKRHWRDASRIDDVATGLAALRADVLRLSVQTLALPALGCGLGGLAWADVRPLIEQAFADLATDTLVFEPRE